MRSLTKIANVRVADVQCNDDGLILELKDGRNFSLPLVTIDRKFMRT